MNRLIFCETCGECLGEERPNYAKEHLRLFPNHGSFLVKTLYDPLLLDNPDEWFTKKLTNRKLTERNTNHEDNRTLNLNLSLSIPYLVFSKAI